MTAANIEIGTEVFGNWGAMWPVSYGVVTGIIRSVSGVMIPPAVVVEWNDGMGTVKYDMADIKTEASANPADRRVGVYV